MIARFHLRLHHHRFAGWARVVVHSDRAELAAAARAYSAFGVGDADLDALWQANVCGPTGQCHIDHRFLGVMRLPRTVSRADVIHECVHAAATAQRLALGNTIVLGTPLHDHVAEVDYLSHPEELLAFAVGDLADTCLSKLASLADRGVTVTD